VLLTCYGKRYISTNTTAITIKETVTVNHDRYDVYDAWRSRKTFLCLCSTAIRNEVSGYALSLGSAVPKGLGTIDWDADIVREEPGEVLSWKSVYGAMVDNAGEVEFKEAPGNRGTELHASFLTFHLQEMSENSQLKCLIMLLNV
jgi:uncharacterized membrane protein